MTLRESEREEMEDLLIEEGYPAGQVVQMEDRELKAAYDRTCAEDEDE